MNATQETFRRASVGALLSPEEYAECEQRRTERREKACTWLRYRYSDVRDEEVGDRLANDIQTIMRWEDECEKCEDPQKCGHSRCVLEIREEYVRGFREFITRGKPCERGEKHVEERRCDAEFEQSGIPPERRNNVFESFDVGRNTELRAAKGTAVDCAEKNRGLILGGPVGCGKTHLAIAMGMFALKEGRKVRFALVPELLESLKNEMLDGKSALYEQVKRCDVLILDDAGTSKETDWKDERLFMLIDWRYGHKLQTVVTTNAVSEDAFRGLLKGERAERTFSRLMEMTEQVWMEEAQDYRRKKSGDKNG